MMLVPHLLTIGVILALVLLVRFAANHYAKTKQRLIGHILKGDIIPHLAEGLTHAPFDQVRKSKRLLIIADNQLDDPHHLAIGEEAKYFEHEGNTTDRYKVFQNGRAAWVHPRDVVIVE